MTTTVPTFTAQTLVPKSNTLSDINAFFGIASVSIMAYDSDAAGGEIFNLMSTLVGDEVFEPTLGSDLPLRVFEQISATLQMDVRQDVYFAGRDWLQHVQVDDTQTTVFADSGNRLIAIEVAYVFGGAGWVATIPMGVTAQALSLAENGNL
jgi:phage baseplate assembly protein W